MFKAFIWNISKTRERHMEGLGREAGGGGGGGGRGRKEHNERTNEKE